MTDKAIDVSVVIPTCRRVVHVREAIDSALNQQGVTLEVIVVDDDPAGSARVCIDAVDDSRLRYLVRQTPSNRRPAMVRNDGAKLARGRFIHFLDDDDVLVPGALAALMRLADASTPHRAMVFGQVEPFGDNPQVLLAQRAHFSWAIRIASRLKYRWQLAASLVYCPAVLINSACLARRSAFEAIGGFDTSIPVCEDADFWSRMALQGGFAHLDQVVVRYRTGAPSLMHDLVQGDPKLHESYRIIQGKFSRELGRLPALAMKVWARLFVRR